MNACPICLAQTSRYGCGTVRTTTSATLTRSGKVETTESWICYAPKIPGRRPEGERFAEGLADMAKIVGGNRG